jgi:hypothetical protein
MSIENETNADTDDTDLDDFSAEFFGQKEAEPDKTKPVVEDGKDESNDAPPEADQDAQDDGDESDTDDTDVEDTEDEDTEEADEQDEPAEKPKKKNRLQDRISELTAARREAEREAEALRQRLEAIESKLAPKDETPETSAPQSTTPDTNAPKPTDTNEDGTEKYPLGEFDPAYITALTQYNVDKAFSEREAKQQEDAQRAKAQEAMGQLEAEWNGQLETARERYPDFGEKVADLEPMFSKVGEAYGEYLSSTLMSMGNGTDILYYLADHPEQVEKIVNSGAREATLILGRLQAQFDTQDSAPPRKASKAPPPPPTNKGSSAARGRVAPDTDDLDAFETVFFKQK